MRTDFCRILSRVEESTEREEENGSVVLVREHRVLDRSGTRKGHVVVKVGHGCPLLSEVSLVASLTL